MLYFFLFSYKGWTSSQSICDRPGSYNMGQYQQWLHYQEIDRHLRTQLEALEADLARLQECLHLLEQEQPEQLTCLADNPIMQLLAANLNGHSTPPKRTTENTGLFSKPPESLLPALLRSRGLPTSHL